jgi:antitoxin component YwqK of YwqJK toxin-antitoxin module
MASKTMRNFLLALVYIFAAISVAEAQEVNPNGFNKFYYPNGKVSSEGRMLNGKPDGYWKTYYENGNLKSEGNRRNLQLDSTWKFYNDKGVLSQEYMYRDGKKNGLKKTYDTETKKLLFEENFVADVKQGVTNYYTNDIKVKDVPFVNGKEEGVGKEYGKEGIIITITKYRNGYVATEERINRTDKFGKKQGIWRTFYDNGNTKREERYQDDKLDGYVKEFAADGNLLKTEKYEDGVYIKNAAELVRLDVKNEYYDNGKVKTSGTYKDGIPEGVTRIYSEDGLIIGGKTYSNGFVVAEGIYDERGYQQGKWKEYYNDGKLKSEGEYKDGKRIGEWIYYHNNGKIEQRGKFVAGGKPNGEWKWYYETGNLLREEKFRNGKEDGMMIEYSDTGNVITKGDFIDGEKDGPWMSIDGDRKNEGNYKNGQMDGVWKSHFSNGKLAFEGAYVDGNENGKHVYYYDTGQVDQEGKYIMGNREGDWKHYDSAGLLISVFEYKNGEENKIDGVAVEDIKSK